MRRGRTKKEGKQSLGRSRGGFSTKIHLATDALGNAVRFILTGGERNDITQARLLMRHQHLFKSKIRNLMVILLAAASLACWLLSSRQYVGPHSPLGEASPRTVIH